MCPWVPAFEIQIFFTPQNPGTHGLAIVWGKQTYAMLNWNLQSFWTNENKLQGYRNQNTKAVIEKMSFENVFCKLWTHFFQPECVYPSGAETGIFQGWGVTKPISSMPLYSEFLALPKHTLDTEYHINIWQVSPQLNCGDTCQIWMWFK